MIRKHFPLVLTYFLYFVTVVTNEMRRWKSQCEFLDRYEMLGMVMGRGGK